MQSPSRSARPQPRRKVRPLSTESARALSRESVVESLERRTLMASVSGTVYEDANGDANYDADEIVQSGWVIYEDVNGNGRYDDGTAVRTAVDTPRDIPDPGVTTSQIEVTDLPGNVTDLNIQLQIVHAWTPDLVANLIAPDGQRVLLFSQLGDLFAHEDYDYTTLDDESSVRIEDQTPPFTGVYQPMGDLSAVDGLPMSGIWRLEVRDMEPNDEGWLNDWSLIFQVEEPEPATISDGNGYWEFTDVPAGTRRYRAMPDPMWTQTEPAANGGYTLNLTADEAVTDLDFGMMFGTPPAVAVVGRHVFYNDSPLDDNDPAANAGDDAAIDLDKTALLPNAGAATLANYTTFGRGITGIMVDVRGLPEGDSLSANDFTFFVGNNDDPSSWLEGPAPTSVNVRRGAGDGGSDRVTVVWPDYVIRNRWLQVITLPTENTGLEAQDIFYYGNLAGDTGEDPAAAAVNGFDLLSVRRAMAARGGEVDPALDFNQDGRVNALDLALVRASQGQSLTLFSAPAAAFSAVSIAAEAAALRPARVWDESATSVLG